MIVYFAIILIVLLGFCGLAIDIGRMELRQNQLQAAADAGALAAAGELWHSNTTTNGQSIMQAAADADIATYETANGISSTAPSTVVLGPTYGPYIADHSVVQVTVTQIFPTTILGLLGLSSSVLTAKAQAQIPPCMIFLGNPSYSGTYDFAVASSGVNTAQDYWTCPLYTKDGTSIDGHSSYYNSQTRTHGPSSASYFGSTTNPPVYNVPVISDPLSYILRPSAGGCINAAPISDLNQASGTTISFTPGTYCGTTASYTSGPSGCGPKTSTITPALDVEGTSVGGCNQSMTNGGNCTSNPTVSFAPGLYVFVGGVNFACATITGSGVTMYFTNNSSVGYGQMRITSSTWNVSAPVDAANSGIAGISILNDSSWTGTSDDFQFLYSTWKADGVVYLAGTGIYDYGTPMFAPNYLNIVAPNMYNYFGTIHPATNYASLPAGNPLHTVITLVQ